MLSIILLSVSTLTWAGNGVGNKRGVRLTYGVEWGAVSNIIEKNYNLYMTMDDYLTEESNIDYGFGIGGLLEGHIGISYKRASLTMYSGVKSYSKKLHQIPIGMRMIILTEKKYDEGLFVLLDGSVGLSVNTDYKNSYSSSLGLGYRIKLTDGCSLDHSISLNVSNTNPTKIYDKIYNVIVYPNDITKAYSNKLGICLSTSINF